MANRFPLIFNTNANQIQELAASDNIDLTSSGIVNAVSIGATSISVTGVVTATTFVGALTGTATGLSGTPNITVGNITPTSVAISGEGATAVTINSSGINITGVITATSFYGTATSTTNIPNLTGAITSNNTTTSLGSFSSANLATALTDETGSGANVFATSPTLVTPALGTPSSGTLTNCTFPTLNQNTTGTASTATTANALNTSNSYQVAALGIGQAADTGTELDLAGRYAQTSIAVAALNIDCSLGNYYTKTITESSTFTFSNIPASRSYSFTLCVTHDSGTITWPGSVKWPKNTAPTLTTYKKHKFMFITNDGGSVFYGAALVDFTY